MASVGIHPPKTPVTKGSHGIAKATIPNVCKMPGPPAPFVAAQLPNIAKSGKSPKDYSKDVKIEGHKVAIRGASFKSMGDVASKGTGGGLISANTHGPAKFITPGSLTVKIEGKSVHLLGEPMLNNCGASGKPPNTGATMMGLDQIAIVDRQITQIAEECCQIVNDWWDSKLPEGKKHNDCKKEVKIEFDGKVYEDEIKKVIGIIKHECVYKKMGLEKEEPREYENGYSITAEQRYMEWPDHPGYLAIPEDPPPGMSFDWNNTKKPDLIYRSSGDDSIAAVRDLKFPCPPVRERNGFSDSFVEDLWGYGQKEEYIKMFKKRPQIILPIL